MDAHHPDSSVRRGSRIKSALELTAMLMVIVASAAVLLQTVVTWRDRGQASPQQAQAGEPRPPDAPHSLKGAALLGSGNAKVAIVEYSDFECPFCGQFAHSTWPALKQQYVDSGKVLVAFRHLPLSSHKFARSAAVGATCAGQQGKFWEMHDRLFESQNTLNGDTPRALASGLDLDLAAFDQCIRQYATADLSADDGYATKAEIAGTPTFLIGVITSDKTVRVTNILIGARPLARFTAVLDTLLADRGRWPFPWFR
jgi:protein-disulfide isomerase